MASPLPPDPYIALGLPKTTDLDTIKKTYKKLVLKCHPDKFPDESIKAQKQEEFHRIQQAYELISDDDSRRRYDAQVKLAEMRKEVEREREREQMPNHKPEVRTASYTSRNSAPSTATFDGRGPARYEERKPKGFEQYDHYEDRTPRYEPTRRSTRTDRTDREDRTRSDRKKGRDREEKKARSDKDTTRYAYAESDSDEKGRYEAEVRKERQRQDDERRRARARDEEMARRQTDEKRRHSEDHRKSRKDHDNADDWKAKASYAADYIEQSRGGQDTESRPIPTRSNSSQVYEVRRSAAKTKERRDRDRKGSLQEIVEFPERRPPTLQTTTSSPANIRIPRTSPQRSRAEYDRSPPRLSRSETEPIRRADAKPAQPSKLRESAFPNDSGYSSPGTPETQYPAQSQASYPPPNPSKQPKTTQYRYPPSSGAPYSTQEYDPHRTFLREPERRFRSPSPIDRKRSNSRERVATSSARTVPTPSAGARHVSSTPTASYQRPPIPHASSSPRVEDLGDRERDRDRDWDRERDRDRGRERTRRPLFREVVDTPYVHPERTSDPRYSGDSGSYSRRFPERDVQYSSGFAAGVRYAMENANRGGRERDDADFQRPGMSRSATSVY